MPTRNGVRYAKMNANQSNTRDRYMSAITTASHVLRRRKIVVATSEKKELSLTAHIPRM